MNMGKPLGPVARGVIGPVGWPTLMIVLLPALWLLWRSTNPAFYYMEGFACAFMSVPALSGLMLVRILAREGACNFFAQPSPGARWSDWKRVFVLVAIVTALLVSKLPMKVNFWWVQQDLQRMTDAIRDGTAASSFVGQRVGIYRIHRIEPYPNAVKFSFTANGDGFANVTGGERHLHYNHGTHGHLESDWYWFAED